MSVGAAVSYAHLLDPERAVAGGAETQHYIEDVSGKIVEQDLDTVIQEERVAVKLSVPRPVRIELSIFLRRPERETGAYALIGQRSLKLKHAGRKVVNVPLQVNPPHSVDALEPLADAPLDLYTVARRHRDPTFGSFFHQRTLHRS
jgi:hypothetical protein